MIGHFLVDFIGVVAADFLKGGIENAEKTCGIDNDRSVKFVSVRE